MFEILTTMFWFILVLWIAWMIIPHIAWLCTGLLALIIAFFIGFAFMNILLIVVGGILALAG